MPRGGWRPGSGRKKGTSGFDKEAARQRLREIVWANMTPMLEAQVANAKGIKFLILRHSKSGKFIKRIEDASKPIRFDPEHEIVEVWAKDPSVQAFTDLMNRTIDKPAETVNATVDVAITQAIESRLKAARERLAKAKRGNGKPHA